MKIQLLILAAIQVLLQPAQAEPWPKWTMGFYGDGWDVRDADGPELIKIAENHKHDIGIFVSGKRFQGSIDDLLTALKSNSAIPDHDKYAITDIGGSKAIQLFSSMNQKGEPVKVWGLMFVQNNSIIALQGLYKDDAGKARLQRTMLSFKFTNK